MLITNFLTSRWYISCQPQISVSSCVRPVSLHNKLRGKVKDTSTESPLFTVVLETKDQIWFAAQNRDIKLTAGAEIFTPSDPVVCMVPIPHHVIISISWWAERRGLLEGHTSWWPSPWWEEIITLRRHEHNYNFLQQCPTLNVLWAIGDRLDQLCGIFEIKPSSSPVCDDVNRFLWKTRAWEGW